ncbi:MAG TPA: hypothetical protein DCX53_08850 [Anaerolineae bacterium]|nr:hypothetical protein [Anaerolineae bacterium]
MTKVRFALTLNCLILISLIVTSCSGIPTLPNLIAPTPTTETKTVIQQAAPVALVETDPPLETVIGHLSPVTFFFNQGMNKVSVESALSGLPDGTFTWTDEATLVFTPTQPYQPNAKLDITIENSVQSASGFGITEPIHLSFIVADYLRATNLLPEANTTDANVDAAIVASFNQPVVPLGADASSLPSAFTILPSIEGRGEWVNTSTYIFYPEPAMLGGTEYTVSVNANLNTASGVGLDGSVVNAWKFVTARPRVVSVSPSTDEFLPPNPEIKLTFNQPMDRLSVQLNFLLSGTEGSVNGAYAWNDDDTELSFTPSNALTRGIGYTLNVGSGAKSKSGLALAEDYGAVLRSYDQFGVLNSTTNNSATTFEFTAPLAGGNYNNLVDVSPAVDNLDVNVYENSMNLFGDFTPDTDYVIGLAETISDQWGQSLGAPYSLDVHTPPLPPSFNLKLFGSTTVFIRPDEPVLFADAVNVQSAEVTVAPLSFQDFFSLQSSESLRNSYTSPDAVTRSQTFSILPSRSTEIALNLTQDNNQLPPGLYYAKILAPQSEFNQQSIYFIASSHVNLTFKLGAKDALVWAVDLPSQTPISGAPLTIYDDAGNILTSGTTDTKGLWQGAVDKTDGQIYAMLGSPGDQNFSLAVNNWSTGLEGWNYGYAQFVRPPQHEIYMYTDRPIYRPGQTVHYRGAVRLAFNGRYELPSINNIPIALDEANGLRLTDINAQLSPYGTFNGQFQLSPDASPGYYTFFNESLNFSLSFQVAEYRKPEINLNVGFSADETQQGDPAQGNVNARYFFDAPAGNADVHWSLYSNRGHFDLPGYQTGLVGYLSGLPFIDGFIGEGTGQTSPDGTLSISLPDVPGSDSLQSLSLEVTATDDSGLPVSARSEMLVHPADFYIGVNPDQWIGKAKEPIGFDVLTVDWEKKPFGDKTLTAEFKQVRWEKQTDQFGFPNYMPVYTPVSGTSFATGVDGRARLSFIPPTPGTFMVDVSGNGAKTQALIWVGGPGTAAWPDLSNQRVDLTADKDAYKPGETANVFIPNPFVTNSLALVTVERGLVSRAEVVTISGSGMEYSLPLTDDDAPNVYLSVLVLGQGNDFRHGVVNLPVAPEAQELTVRLFTNPSEAGPRENVTFDVVVTDNQKQPVQGEFSLSVVDQAVLALADPNAEDILPAYYSEQPLGIETGLSLAAYTGRDLLFPGGRGGGGGDGPPFIREDFPDTAYWNPSLITNSEGRGQVTMTLPDSLTTWQVDVRGLTIDTKVGQAETQIVSTKPLLIRPVTPRFLVSGDHVLMAAIVNNNTEDTLSVSVNLQMNGFVLDTPESATREFEISPNAQARVEWWGTAGLAETADLIFSVTTNGRPSLQDSARPVWGQLPILQYTSPQALVTGGVLRGAASQQEVISLPRTFIPGEGSGLDVELSPSLAGSLLSALDAMEVPPYSVSAEASLSYLLPNIEVHRALNSNGLSDPALSERVETNLNASVSRLLSLQNQDGGWSWWGGRGEQKSDPYISAYVLFGLLRTQLIGVTINEEAIERAITFLQESASAVTASTTGADLDQTAFIQFVLSQSGVSDQAITDSLYDARDRMNPTGRAWLALTIHKTHSADARIRELISNLETVAIRTASSAHWETPSENIFQRGSAIYTTAVVVYALSQVDAANPLVIDAVRYLAAHRNVRGLWNIGHENAWAMIALNEAMLGMGDLRADFTFNAALNGSPLTSGDVNGIQIEPLTANVPLEFLSANSPNLLTIQRDDGLGRLYYKAVLKVNRPVHDVKPLNAGMGIDRVYCQSKRSNAEAERCTSLSSIPLASGQFVTAQLTLTLPNDSYYVMVEDHIPAGMEVLNRSLKTSEQQGVDSTGVQVQYDDADPFANGWGWWLFNEPQIHDEGILFSAEFLPAGTYVLTYTLVPLQAGEFQVLPAHAWQSFFPEVQGTSAGAVFEIKP